MCLSCITRIKNTAYVVGCEEDTHYLLKKGEVVYEGNTIIYIGNSYEDPVDEEIDAKGGLVIPGFINLHTHLAASPLEKGFVEDTGNPFHFMSGLYEFLAMTTVKEEYKKDVLQFSIAEVMKTGSTTVFEQGFGDEDTIQTIGESGVRAIVGPLANSQRFCTHNGISVDYEPNPMDPQKRLQYVMDMYEKYHDDYEGRMDIAMYLGQADTCHPEFLDEAARAAGTKKDMTIAIHAAQSINEYQKIAYLYGKTPAEYLEEHHIAGEHVHYGHYFMPRGYSLNAMKIGDELNVIANNKTHVMHCPWSFGRRGMILESFHKYRKMGINIGMGTDTFPQDMLMELRYAAIFCKIAEGADPFTGTARDVFNAATIGGARALRREDIGRIQKGCKADIVIVNLHNLECTPVRDPIKVLVYSASSHDIDKVIVDGKILVEDGKAKYINEAHVCERTQEAQEHMMATLAERDYAHRTAQEISPMSFEVRG